ncbi:MAG: Dna2/Cas4 domain-containing protein [Planctomycetaceae bacterium]|nr:Dna2/Cas4 domain-containing protein [Planctomycetaceae bacterium]
MTRNTESRDSRRFVVLWLSQRVSGDLAAGRKLSGSSREFGVRIIDAVRRRDGVWVAYEHKRGRCQRGEKKEVLPWPSDRIQAIAYAVMLEEALGEPVPQARVRYHAENVTAIVAIDDAPRADLHQAIARARELHRACDALCEYVRRPWRRFGRLRLVEHGASRKRPKGAVSLSWSARSCRTASPPSRVQNFSDPFKR